jgi:hypothetical protein
MRLSLLAALGIAAFLGTMTVDANAAVRSSTVVSSPRGTAIVRRGPSGMRTATIVRRGSSGMRTATIVRRGPSGMRTATIVRGARGSAICRSVIVNGVRVRRCS